MPWQFGQLGLTESGGNRPIKYADALVNGVSTFVFKCEQDTDSHCSGFPERR